MFIHLASLDSTNAEAKRRIARGEGAHADVILADEQKQGIGRKGGSWFSPIGNLYFSLIIEPRLHKKVWARYSLLSAVILSRVLGSIVEPERFSFKWPNDILIDGLKVSGILLESVYRGEQPFLIIGVGINILHHPDDSNFPSTSLAACGAPEILPDTLLQRFIAEFDVNWQTFQIEGFDSFYRRIEPYLYALNCMISLSLSEHQIIEGYCRGMNEDGHLVIEDKDGRLCSYASGEVLRVRPRS